MNVCAPQGCTISPQNGVVLQGHFGSDKPDHDVIQAFSREFTDVDIELTFINFASGMLFPWQAAQTAAANNAVLFIKIEPYFGTRFPKDGFDYLRVINAGTFDHLFRAIGREARAFGLPIIMTFGHEMNIGDKEGVYPWTAGAEEKRGEKPGEEYKQAYMRVHDLISEENFVDAQGKSVEGGGAHNVTWVLNFDAGYYARNHKKFTNAEQIREDISRFIPIDPKNPQKSYFDWVAVDFYVQDYRAEYNLASPPQVIRNYLDPVLAAINQSPALQSKPLSIGEFGVSLGFYMTRQRKGQLIKAFLDYIVEYNNNKSYPNPISLYIYYNVNKTWDSADQGYWKIDHPEVKGPYKAWITAQQSALQPRATFYQNSDPGKKLVVFQGPAVQKADKYVEPALLPTPQVIPEGLKSWNKLVPAPKKSIIGDYNTKLAKPLLKRKSLEKYMSEAQMEESLAALLQMDTNVPITFDVSSRGQYRELALLHESDDRYPETALAPYLHNPNAYWENIITFVSVYTQKAIEAQDKGKIASARQICTLLLQRYEKQKQKEAGLAEKNYAYPSIHNLALLKLTHADATSQLKNLDEQTYLTAINMCLEAVGQLQSLEKKSISPSGADYFSLAKTVITIGDLKVRMAQLKVKSAQEENKRNASIDVRRAHEVARLKHDLARFPYNEADEKAWNEMQRRLYLPQTYFAEADRYFREAEKLYQAVADLDIGAGTGLKLDMEIIPGKRLILDIPAERMLAGWDANQAKSYILRKDKKRGFQSTYHFLKALASIKIQATFLENPTKKPEDYEMQKLFVRLGFVQNSLPDLVRDPSIEVGFLLGLAKTVKANLILMIGDRAQYDTSQMDRASALNHYNRLLEQLGHIVPELKASIESLQGRLIERELGLILYQEQKKIAPRGSAENFLGRLLEKAKTASPTLAGIILALKDKLRENKVDINQQWPDHVPTIDDNFLVDFPVAPFKRTASSSQRFALIILSLVETLAEEVGQLSQPKEAGEKPHFPYLYTVSKLLLSDIKVRSFYIVEDQVSETSTLDLISDALNSRLYYAEEAEDWETFQALHAQGNFLVLKREKRDLRDAIGFLTLALAEADKFIYPARIFYKTQLYILLARVYCELGRDSSDDLRKAQEIVAKITAMLTAIEKVAPQIGWNLKDFKLQYSRVVIRSINTISYPRYKPIIDENITIPGKTNPEETTPE